MVVLIGVARLLYTVIEQENQTLYLCTQYYLKDSQILRKTPPAHFTLITAHLRYNRFHNCKTYRLLTKGYLRAADTFS